MCLTAEPLKTLLTKNKNKKIKANKKQKLYRHGRTLHLQKFLSQPLEYISSHLLFIRPSQLASFDVMG